MEVFCESVFGRHTIDQLVFPPLLLSKEETLKVRLIDAQIPISMWHVTARNNTLRFVLPAQGNFACDSVALPVDAVYSDYTLDRPRLAYAHPGLRRLEEVAVPPEQIVKLPHGNYTVRRMLQFPYVMSLASKTAQNSSRRSGQSGEFWHS